MLLRLSIKNYAIIDHLELQFASSLNVITGETGAGKSIIVGALGLILGERADSGVLFKKEQKTIVEGWFKTDAKTSPIAEFLAAHELDQENELVVRREIAPSGKSRAFINDTPVNLSQLGQLSGMLVDLHQQFDTQDLGNRDFQREVLDALAGNFKVLANYREIFAKKEAAQSKLTILKDQKAAFEKEFDYHQFQFNELEEAGFHPNELEDLEQELKLISNAEGIKTVLEKTYSELKEGDEPVLRKLKASISQLQQYAELHQGLPALAERLQSAYLELQDIAGEAEKLNDDISADAGRLEKINERLSLGYRLLKKYSVQGTSQLLEIKKELEEKLQAVLNIDDAITAAEKEYLGLQKEAEALASKISAGRRSQIAKFEEQVNKLLFQVGMPNARLKAEIESLTALRAHGGDDIRFLFDANKSNDFKPIAKVASGGELSRLMLCIKSLVASSMDLPTLIFDEIDTGISGEAAKQVGMIMKDLSSSRQVISITHQPQIAGKADAHFLVFKEVKNNAVSTGVRLLDTDERIVAIAKMLSGEKPTAAAMENAKEMMN